MDSMNRIVGPQNYRQWIVLAIGAIAMVSFSIGNVAIAEEEKERDTSCPRHQSIFVQTDF